MTINCKGRLIDFEIPKVMGILNLTPDSFYDGGKFENETGMLRHVEKMLADGADFIDIGGYSSKPGAGPVSQDEELGRIIPAIAQILKHFPEVLLSVDTFRSEVARQSVMRGAAIVNDISAGNLDQNMMQAVAQLQVPYIMMHMRGNPTTMQKLTDYGDIVKEILFYFSDKIAKSRSLGINDLIVDPGFGFAKTLAQNFEIMQKLDLFTLTGLPLLAGVSRKSMVYNALGTSAEAALNGTTALNMLALTKGAKILRVHDVKEAVETVKLFQMAKVQ